MKNILLLLLLFTGIVNGQIINFPDANFKVALIGSNCVDLNNDSIGDVDADTNDDGEIQVAEAASINALIIDVYVINTTGLETFTSLEHLQIAFSANFANASYDLSFMSQLKTLRCTSDGGMTLNLSGLSNLEKVNCPNSGIMALNVSGLVGLKELDCSSNYINSLDLTGLISLEIVNCNSNQLTSFTLSTLPNLKSLDCSSNQQLFTLDVTGISNVISLDCAGTGISTLAINNFTQLTTLDCSNNSLSTLNITGTNALTSLNCSQNSFTTLSLANATNLTWLDCSQNQLTSIALSTLLQLEHLNCSFNNITAIDTTPLINLEHLYCGFNELNTINVDLLTNLTQFDCSHNNLTAIDVTQLAHLQTLGCNDNILTTLDISNSPDLYALLCNNNQLTELDMSNCPYLTNVICNANLFASLDFSQIVGYSPLDPTPSGSTVILLRDNPNLQYLNYKNGIPGMFYNTIENCPNLTFICVNEADIPAFDLPGVEVNTYCSFTPNNNYNTITGIVKYDTNNDGCDSNNPNRNNIRIDINEGTNHGAAFSTDGSYTFYVQTGDFMITPNIENPSWYTISPATTTVSFTQNNNTVTQDFCFAPNGLHSDIEIILTPVITALPGFDALYKLVYKNKGNQVSTGTINLIFDDTRTDFISATPTISNQSVNLLSWSYTDLMPLQTRSIDLVLNLNSPLENPPLIDGSILHFTVEIHDNTMEDETPSDNIMNVNQTVVNSYDPNDKTCLEGNTITPENVGKYLHYNINFENIGTADAVNIVVKDIIDTTKFDINSLQLLYASHAVETKISGNKVEFIFKNINLPSSIQNPIGGHGNVLFKIKTLPTLVVGDEVSNTANIFFDYNAPIQTNEARTTIATLIKNDFIKDETITIAPNPTKNRITVSAKNKLKSVMLFDVQGRLLQTVLENNKTTTLDISSQANGVYFLKVITEIGSSVEKIVKEH